MTERQKKERLLALLEEKKRRQSILYWVQGKVNENGKPYTFHQHEFQRDILDDFSPEIAVMKASQIGLSTAMIMKCRYMQETTNYNIIYTLPTLQNDVQKFVPSKVDMIIDKNGWQYDRSTTYQKIYRDSVWFFGATSGEKEAISSTADVLVHDEIDRSDLNVIDVYKSRLGHSEYGRRWQLSNPSVPSASPDTPNISYLWGQSDQKYWFVKCSCGQGNFGGWQYMTWPDSFDMERRIYRCIHCGKEITPDMIGAGQWVAKYPGKRISGYWIPRMCAGWQTADRIIGEYEDRKTDAFFWNFVLGLPYMQADVVINRQLIMQNLIEGRVPDYASVVIGVDVGAKLHIVIGDMGGIFRVVEGDWETLEALYTLHQPRMVVIDAHPEITKAKEFQKKHKGRVLRCYYRSEKNQVKPAQSETYTVDYDTGEITAWRTEAIDLLIQDLAERRVFFYVNDWLTSITPIFSGGGKRNSSYVEHWESMYLAKDEETEVRSWEHTGPDHFAHASVYWWLAKSLVKPSTKKHKVRRQ